MNNLPKCHFRQTDYRQTVFRKRKNGKPKRRTTNNNRTNNDFNNNDFNNNDENILSGNPTAYPYRDVIDYLNQRTGKNYKSTTKKNQTVIRARTDEGFTIDDFKKLLITKWLNGTEQIWRSI